MTPTQHTVEDESGKHWHLVPQSRGAVERQRARGRYLPAYDWVPAGRQNPGPALRLQAMRLRGAQVPHAAQYPVVR